MSSNQEEAPKNEEMETPEKILEEKANLNSELQENYTYLSRKMRIYIFSLFLILSVVVDLESGIFNSSVDYLQADLNMNNAEYGLFVSISFTGRIIGLVIFMFLLNFKHRKYTLIATIFLHGSSYALYQITSNSYILTFAKMFAAGNKVCASIYRPVWIEQFGLSKYKSVFFSLVQIMSSYGQIIGFTLGSLLFKSDWKTGLLSILVLMYIIAIGFLIVPGKYFFRSYMYYEDKLVDIEVPNEEPEDISRTSSIDSLASESDNGSKSSDKKKKRKTVFVDTKKVEKQKREKSGEKKKKKKLSEKIKKFEDEGINLKVNINKTDGKTQAEINKDIKLIKNLITELNAVQTYPDKIEKTIDLKVNVEGLQKEITEGLNTLRKINPNIIID